MKKSIEKLLIISPGAISPAGIMPRIHPPMGAVSVLSQAKQDGYEVALFDVAAEGLMRKLSDPSYQEKVVSLIDDVIYWRTGCSIEETLKGVSDFRPDVIGISCLTIVDRSETAIMAKAIKQAFPEKPLILGGHEASSWYDEILGDGNLTGSIPEIDYVVVGPGQPVITGLLRYLADPDNQELPSGVAFRQEGKVVFTGPSEFIPDRFALPDFSLLPAVIIAGRYKPMDLYSFIANPHAGRIQNLLGRTSPISYMPLMTSYGCGFHCSFCDVDNRLLRYSNVNVEKMISTFSSLFGLDYVDLMDNNFAGGNSLSRQTAFEILSEFAVKKLSIGFSNGLTFESMARDDFRLIRWFADYGQVKHIAFPCENGNDRILKMIEKPHNLSLVRKVLEFARNTITTTNREGFFIGGFPETNGQSAETPQELESTYELIKECLESQYLHQAIFLTLSPVTRKYRLQWRQRFPQAAFEHCLFSKQSGVWPYDSSWLIAMHQKVSSVNSELGRCVTRNL